MKKTLLAGALLSSALVPGAVLAQAYGDTARVISATPLYDRVAEPRHECHEEQVTAYEERRSVSPASETRESGGVGHGTAAGAIVGGLVGNQVDRDNDAAATRDVVVERVPVTRNVQRCSDVADTRDVIVGYDVRYEYNGHEMRARLPYDPGPQMPVNVDVRPPAPPAPLADPRMPRYRGTY